jgi:hypothetical protein
MGPSVSEAGVCGIELFFASWMSGRHAPAGQPASVGRKIDACYSECGRHHFPQCARDSRGMQYALPLGHCDSNASEASPMCLAQRKAR